MKYAEKQYGWFVMVVLVGTVCLLFLDFIKPWSQHPVNFPGLIILSFVFTLCLLLFFQMKTVVDNENIRISFGVGIIRKRIDLAEIESIKEVKNKWYQGFGVRLIKYGWLYNIQGLKAVELQLKTKSVIRIGTADSQNLKKKIEQRKNQKA